MWLDSIFCFGGTLTLVGDGSRYGVAGVAGDADPSKVGDGFPDSARVDTPDL